MTHKDRVEICDQCLNRGFNPKLGLICSLTNAQPDFEDSCPEYKEDIPAIRMKALNQKIAKDETKNIVNKGRIALFAIAAIHLIVCYFQFSAYEKSFLYILPDLVIAIGFVFLGFLSFRKTYIALLIGFYFFLSLQILVAVTIPESLMNGIYIKIAIIVSLIVAMREAKNEERSKRQ